MKILTTHSDLARRMTGHDAARPFLDRIDAREREITSEAEHLRARVEELTARLAALDEEADELRVTRRTLTVLADGLAPEPAPQPAAGVPDPPRLSADPDRFADTDQPLRARDLCQALDLPIFAKNTEGTRSKAETPGQPEHPHGTRTRFVRASSPLTTAPGLRPTQLTQHRNGRRFTYGPLRSGAHGAS